MFSNIRPSKLQYVLVGLFIFGLFAAVVVIGIYLYTHREWEFSLANADWGSFGDFVGGTLNPLYGFLAFMGLLYTIALQSKELDVTRITTKWTIELASAQTDLMRQQTEHLHREQKFSDLEKAIHMQAELADQALEQVIRPLDSQESPEITFKKLLEGGYADLYRDSELNLPVAF